MAVSPTWYEICSYPLLWKELYLKEGWTVAEEVIDGFETQLLALQAKFESQFRRRRRELIDNDLRKRWITANSFEPESASNNDGEHENPPSCRLEQSYNIFFGHVQRISESSNNYQLLKTLHEYFRAIALSELGETVYQAATFTLNSHSAPRLQVDWRYLYSHRSLLENNWRGGAYQATLLDGAPDVTQPNQREGIYCVYFDRTYLAVGSRDNYIRLFRMSDLAHVNTLKSHEGSVLCLQLDSRRNLLVSGSSDSTLKIWQLDPPQLLQTLRGHSEPVLGLQLLDKYIVSCSKDSSARIWEFCTNSETNTETNDDPTIPYPKYVLRKILKGHRAAVNSVHVKDDIIATASGDRTVRLWRLSTGESIRTIGYHPRGIACVNITGQLVVTGSSDHVIRIFSQNTGEEVRALRGHSGLVRTIQTDSTKIISGSYDQSIRVWDIKSGDILHEFSNCHESKYSISLYRFADSM
jgi:WD40 repeat protein